jgi:ribosomal protein L29
MEARNVPQIKAEVEELKQELANVKNQSAERELVANERENQMKIIIQHMES